MLIAELSILATPFLLGKSIDGLLVGNWYWILLLGTSYFLSNFFNYKRMVYDTKVYTSIYNNIALTFLKRDDVDVSTKIARTDMAHEIVNVLEAYVHYYIGTIVTIVGSLIFIYSENWKAKSIENGYLSSESFFNRRRKIEIYESTIQGKNWFLVNSIKYVFLLLSIILLVTTTKNITIGSVLTVYSYVNNFLISLLSAPVAIEMFLRISDVLKRLD